MIRHRKAMVLFLVLVSWTSVRAQEQRFVSPVAYVRCETARETFERSLRASAEAAGDVAVRSVLMLQPIRHGSNPFADGDPPDRIDPQSTYPTDGEPLRWRPASEMTNRQPRWNYTTYLLITIQADKPATRNVEVLDKWASILSAHHNGKPVRHTRDTIGLELPAGKSQVLVHCRGLSNRMRVGIRTLNQRLCRRELLRRVAEDFGPAAAGPIRIEQDWLFQANYQVTVERIADEIGWMRELSARRSGSAAKAAGEALAGFERRLAEAGAEGLEGLYFDIRRAKRELMLSDPAIDFSSLLLIDQPYPTSVHETQHRNAQAARHGGRLLVVDGLEPGAPVRRLAPRPGSEAAFWRPDLSFDADRVVFCMKRADEPSFRLYETNVDGTGLRRLTNSRYDDLDPIYLPDGRILFSTTRCNTYIRCGPSMFAYVLAICNSDGSDIYIVSRGNECDWTPALLPDGRVLYTRWEYTDKPVWRIQSLWTMNQDGTGVATYWGNQSVWPDALVEARAIPGTDRVMFAGVGHHHWFNGSIGILDADKGRNFPLGLQRVTQEIGWPECGQPEQDEPASPNYHRAGAFTSFKAPYPLSEELFLVSATGARDLRRGSDTFDLYLMDIHGNRELLYSGRHNILHAMPVSPRKRPPVHADRVAWPGTGRDHEPARDGVLYSPDVCQGVDGLDREKFKYLRVLQIDHRTYSTWNVEARFAGPATSVVMDDGVKRILGTVPVAHDGSVSFQVPPGQALHFQLLDADYKALHTMRSFSGVMPGEVRGCLGCHEQHSTAPPEPRRPTSTLSLAPAKLTPPPWGADVSIGYERFVQPVLDKHCGKCHQGDGKARKKLDLTFRPGGYSCFTEPYLTLVGEVWHMGRPIRKAGKGPGIAGAMKVENFGLVDGRAYDTTEPMKHLSPASELIRVASSGEHHDVKVTGRELRQLIAWVDANCPYRGDAEIRAMPDPSGGRFDDMPVRPRLKTAPVIDRFNVPQDPQ